MIRDGIDMNEEDALLYDQYKNEYEYYHKLQFIKKILLNSKLCGASISNS